MGKPIGISIITSPDGPVWNFEEQEDLHDDLHEQPANHRLRDRHFINIASLQLGEELL
jgi:hypothetical protein